MLRWHTGLAVVLLSICNGCCWGADSSGDTKGRSTEAVTAEHDEKAEMMEAEMAHPTDVRPDSPRDGWSYSDLDAWPRAFPQCSGNQQSPVNLRTSNAAPKSFPPFTFQDYDVYPPIETLTDNGHTLVAEENSALVASVWGGGLCCHYRLKQFHFHWGSTSDQGSEHTVDGGKYPMEMHLVHYNTRYGDIRNATGHADGLMVLAVLFHLADHDNPSLVKLVAHARNLTEINISQRILHAPPFSAMLPRNTSAFYRYFGSLTTPPCSEEVTWTVFRDSVPVSEAQLKVLRHLKDHHGHDLADNFRPTQPLNSRTVERSFYDFGDFSKGHFIDCDDGGRSHSEEYGGGKYHTAGYPGGSDTDGDRSYYSGEKYYSSEHKKSYYPIRGSFQKNNYKTGGKYHGGSGYFRGNKYFGSKRFRPSSSVKYQSAASQQLRPSWIPAYLTRRLGFGPIYSGVRSSN